MGSGGPVKEWRKSLPIEKKKARRSIRERRQTRRPGSSEMTGSRVEERRTGGSVDSVGEEDSQLSGQWRSEGQAAQWTVEE
jgi:hypothetical protein